MRRNGGLISIMKLTGITLVISGLCLLAFPFFSDVVSHQEQMRIKAEIVNDGTMSGAAGGLSPMLYTRLHTRISSPVTAFAVLTIPDLKTSWVVVEGTDPKSLKNGPGWEVSSDLPGKGNTVIFGHRNVWGSFFRHLDRVRPGNYIYLQYRENIYRYRVSNVYTVEANDMSILKEGEQPILTLVTCTNGARQRLVVKAVMD